MRKYKSALETILFILNTIIICICANSYYIMEKYLYTIPIFIVLFIAGNLLPMYSRQPLPNKKFKICRHGTKCLKIFLVSASFTVVFNIVTAFMLIPDDWIKWCIGVAVAILAEAILFWNGILSVYCTSIQLGIKIRILGLIFGMVPVLNLIMLGKIIRTTTAEINLEWNKYTVNMERKDEKICATKYPVLMIHGVFFRDSKYFNYWGRIPKELENNGARIFYGEHQSAASVVDSAAELSERIKDIVNRNGCEKVNIIAHSKGGLDCRYAIHKYNLEPYVASLTTINTPHRGCKFADYLLNKAPEGLKNKIADTYNNALRKFGDSNPDFMAAVTDLTSARCEALNKELPNPVSVFCQSTGSKLNRATGGKFPLNFSYNLVKNFDGYNDGLVGEQSFKWGENFAFLSTNGRRGISHGDMIDLNRENIPGFDVREWYVQLVADLKKRGY